MKVLTWRTVLTRASSRLKLAPAPTDLPSLHDLIGIVSWGRRGSNQLGPLNRCGRAFPYRISAERKSPRRWKETVLLNLEPTPGFEPGTFSLP